MPARQTATIGKLGGALTVGEIAVVADAMEAVGQDVEQEPADELVGAKGHHLLLVVLAIFLPAEAYRPSTRPTRRLVVYLVFVHDHLHQRAPGDSDRTLAS